MRDSIVKLLKTLVPADVKIEVSAPPEEQMGHYSTNVAFAFGKREGRTPIAAAEELVKRISSAADTDWLLKAEAVPPGFVNFFLKKEILFRGLKEVLRRREKFGSSRIGKGQTVIIEYSDPNIAKPMHIGHLPATIIGDALGNVYEFLGYKVFRWNYLGDWGTQFGKLIAAYKLWGNKEAVKADPIGTMLNLYIRFHKEAEKNQELEDRGREEFRKLEAGDRVNRRLWERFRRESLKGFEKTYKLLGVKKFDLTIGESFYENRMKAAVEELKKAGVAKLSEGSVIVPLEQFDLPPALIQKSDGASLYLTRDIENLRYRLLKYKPQKILYVVSNEQALHFEQLFAIAKLLNLTLADLTHVKFGMILSPEKKKFSTREGRLIPLDDVLNEAIERSRRVVEGLNSGLPEKEKEKIAKIVGIGAVKFFDLAQNRLSDIVFDWDKLLNLKGASAPYLQYAYARLRSILRKASGVKRQVSGGLLLKEESELNILGHLIHFSEAVEDAALRYEPNRIAEYLLKLTEKANHFYESLPVLKAEKGLREARLTLIQAVTIVIKNGLNLLGIEAPERM